MRDCENAEIRDLLPDHARGALAGVVRSRVEAHLAACDACRAELALLRAVRAAHPAPAVDVARIVASLPRSGAAAGAMGTAAPGIVSLEEHRTRREVVASTRSGLPWRRIVAAAVIVVAVGAGVVRNRGVRDGIAPVAGTVTAAAPESIGQADPTIVATPGTTPVVVAGSDTPGARRSTSGSTRLAPRGADSDAFGALGGIASDASDDELEALIGGLESLSGIPDVESIEAEQSDDRGSLE